MFKIENGNIHLSRGDSAIIQIKNESSSFEIGDEIKFSIMKKNNCEAVLLSKVYTVRDSSEDNSIFEIFLTPEDSKSFCPPIKTGNLTYWYEIELKSGDVVNTLIGYDDNGAKELIIYPEAVSENEG